MNTRNSTIFTLTRCALLSAMAVILFYIEIPILVSFYKLDFSTLPAILAGFAMGPMQGVAVVAIKDIIHYIFGSSTGGIGEVADFFMSCAFVIPASLIYRKKKNRIGAIKSMIVGSLIMVVVAMLVNYFVLIPVYQKFMPIDEIIAAGSVVFPFIDSKLDFVICITGIFNAIKAIALSIITYLFYKRVSPILHQKTGREGGNCRCSK